MRTPKARKLKSGNWRIQLQINGTRHSITAPTKAEAQEEAKQLFAGYEREKKTPLTVGKAMERYISDKEGVLSPSTIRGYRVIIRNYFKDISSTNLNDLKSRDVQKEINKMVKDGKSAKTISNAHGFLSTVLKEYRPKFTLTTKLPQKEAHDIRVFTEEEMTKVWDQVRGTKYELPILLASWLGLRMSEIRGIKFCDIQDGRVHIHTAVVSGEKGPVEKGTKTTSGDRWIKLPQEILSLIFPQEINSVKSDAYICPYTHSMIYKAFINACKDAGVEPCRFHDLRHFAASESHALGIPDKYSMKRMGHKTDNMLKSVYQHTMRDKEDVFSDQIDDKMRELYKNAHKNAHENQTSA